MVKSWSQTNLGSNLSFTLTSYVALGQSLNSLNLQVFICKIELVSRSLNVVTSNQGNVDKVLHSVADSHK